MAEWYINTQIKVWHYYIQTGNMPSLNYISFPEANYLEMQMFMKANYYSHYKMISMKQICFRSTFNQVKKE